MKFRAGRFLRLHVTALKPAAKELNYQPSLLARSLRNRRTLSIGILVPELSEGYHNQLVGGIGDHLIETGYFYFAAHHRRRKHLVEEYGRMLLSRGAEALIAIRRWSIPFLFLLWQSVD